MKYFLDTNIFLRTFIKEDQTSYGECKALLEAVKKGRVKATTANVILAEIAWVLGSYYGVPKDEVVEAIKGVINLRGLKIVDGYHQTVALSYFESKNVKYIDAMCASIKQIHEGKWTIVSYDKDFDKLDIQRKEPADI